MSSLPQPSKRAAHPHFSGRQDGPRAGPPAHLHPGPKLPGPPDLRVWDTFDGAGDLGIFSFHKGHCPDLVHKPRRDCRVQGMWGEGRETEIERWRKRQRHREKEIDRERHRNREMQTEEQRYRETKRQRETETDRRRETQKWIQKYRERNKKEMEAERWTDRDIEIQRETETERDTMTELEPMPTSKSPDLSKMFTPTPC